MAAPTKIELRDVDKRFVWTKDRTRHEVHVLDDVSLDIGDGEFLTVIGPSGCGKTTLLRIIGGLTDIQGGSVRIDGRPVTGPGPDRSVVFQSFGLFPWKTVLENVAFPLQIRRMRKQELRESCRRHLDLVGLEKFADAYPHQLSGGMQQRVGLARALATDPDILLMDEPFGAIDAQTRELMQEELQRIWSSRKKTVLFITHDLDEAVTLADRIVVLTRGPGQIRAIIDVDLPRPRWDYDVRGHPTFIEIRSRIWQMLRGDLLAQEQAEGIDAVG